MKVFLLQGGEGRWFGFAAEPGAGVDRRHIEGPIGRMHRRLQEAVRANLTGPDHVLGRLLRWLWGRIHRDESLLRHLRMAPEVVVHHASDVSPEEARAAWMGFLARGRRRHLSWLVVDALLSPLTVLLAPLPGPNVVGYWVVFRAACHWLAWRGARRAARGDVRLGTQADEGLDARPRDEAD